MEDLNGESVCSILLYPNPVRDFATLNLGISTEKARVIVTDMQAGEVIRQNISPKAGETLLDCTNLAPGTYFVRMIRDNNATTRKFTKL